MATTYLARQTILPPRPSLLLALRALCHRGLASLRRRLEDLKRARHAAQAQARLRPLDEARQLPVSALLARLGAQEQLCVARMSRRAPPDSQRRTAVTAMRRG